MSMGLGCTVSRIWVLGFRALRGLGFGEDLEGLVGVGRVGSGRRWPVLFARKKGYPPLRPSPTPSVWSGVVFGGLV